MTFDGRAYQARFDVLESQGMDVHGEARLVLSFGPGSVLDAGCGTGRVAIELARCGVDVVGVDLDESMIAEAHSKAPQLEWVRADLSTLSLGRVFDVVVLAGNVPLFCPEPDRSSLVRSCASHVGSRGHLIAGFQIDGNYRLEEFGRDCVSSGLVPVHRWSTWERGPESESSAYSVSVWSRPG